ncbi:HNH endonuclease [Streptomyces fulvorobeus]
MPLNWPENDGSSAARANPAAPDRSWSESIIIGRPVRHETGYSITSHFTPYESSGPPRGPSRRDVLRRWEELEWWACSYCDAPFGPMVVAEADHVTPLAKGGAHEWSNLTPACRECNRLKSDRDMSEWLAILTGQTDTEREVTVTR